jgi:hypothetical protein
VKCPAPLLGRSTEKLKKTQKEPRIKNTVSLCNEQNLGKGLSPVNLEKPFLSLPTSTPPPPTVLKTDRATKAIQNTAPHLSFLGLFLSL